MLTLIALFDEIFGTEFYKKKEEQSATTGYMRVISPEETLQNIINGYAKDNELYKEYISELINDHACHIFVLVHMQEEINKNEKIIEHLREARMLMIQNDDNKHKIETI